MTFGTGQVADALGMTGQALGNLVRDFMPDRPANRHYRFTPDEVLWLSAYRHARAAGLEAFPARAFVGGQGMLFMLRTLLTLAAPDPAEAVKRLRNVPILFGCRYCFTESGHETELVGEPLLIEAQRLPDKLTARCIGAGDVGIAQLTVFLTPLTRPLNILERVIEENRNVAESQ